MLFGILAVVFLALWMASMADRRMLIRESHGLQKLNAELDAEANRLADELIVARRDRGKA